MEFDGSRVRRFRDRLGWSQRQLSEASGIPQPTLSTLERGKVDRPSMDTLLRLSRALNVTLDDLTGPVAEPSKERRSDLAAEQPASSGEGERRPAPSLEELVAELQTRVRELDQPVRIPVLNVKAHAHFEPGFPIDLERFGVVRYVNAGREFAGRDIWGVDITGDCLAPDLIDGDLALFEMKTKPRNDRYAVVIHDGVLMVKQAEVIDGRVVRLHDRHREEPDYEPIFVNGHTIVLGRVVQSRREW